MMLHDNVIMQHDHNMMLDDNEMMQYDNEMILHDDEIMLSDNSMVQYDCNMVEYMRAFVLIWRDKILFIILDSNMVISESGSAYWIPIWSHQNHARHIGFPI